MSSSWISRLAKANLTTLLVLTCAGSAPRQQAQTLDLIFLNVGQGDALVIRSPEGKVALIDAGPGPDIVSLLRAHGIESVEIAIASHPHADHIGGMEGVIRYMPVRYYMDNGVPHTTPTYMNLMRALRASDVTYLEAKERTISLGSADLTVLPPPPEGDLNNTSVGIVVKYGEFRALLTGDSQIEELNYWLNRGVPDVTLLKAAHHGAENGVSPAWLNTTRPEVIVISCGMDNQYGHPDRWALRYYEKVARQVYRTDLDGEVRVLGRRDGEYEVLTENRNTAAMEPSLDRAPTAAAGGLSLWVFADAPGNDHYNLNGEYVVVTNNSSATVDIGGWILCDAAGACFTFPAGASIPADGKLTLYTGSGRSDGTNFYMNRGRAVWNNRGDVATLRDRAGRVVARYVY